MYKEVETEKTSFELENLSPSTEVHFWVRVKNSVYNDLTSPPSDYSEKLICSTTL